MVNVGKYTIRGFYGYVLREKKTDVYHISDICGDLIIFQINYPTFTNLGEEKNVFFTTWNAQLMVDWWFGTRWFGFLASHCPQDPCMLYLYSYIWLFLMVKYGKCR